MTANTSVVSPNAYPVLNAVMLASRMSGRDANLALRKLSVPSVGRWYSQDSRPRANMFFARDASLRDKPNSLTASTVMPVRSRACTW